MTASLDDDKPDQSAARPPAGERHVYGPRPVGAVLPGVVRPAFKRRSPAASRIMTDWADIVGPMLAASAVPRRLSAGTLVLGCSGPMALELQHLSDQITARINTHVGSAVVARIRLVQEGQPPPPPRHRDDPPDAATTHAATRAVEGVPDGPLRDSLLRLGQRVLRRPT